MSMKLTLWIETSIEKYYLHKNIFCIELIIIVDRGINKINDIYVIKCVA